MLDSNPYFDSNDTRSKHESSSVQVLTVRLTNGSLEAYFLRKSLPEENNYPGLDLANHNLQSLFPDTSLQTFVLYRVYLWREIDSFENRFTSDSELPSIAVFLQGNGDYFFVPGKGLPGPSLKDIIRAVELVSIAHRWPVLPIVTFNNKMQIEYAPKVDKYIIRDVLSRDTLRVVPAKQLRSLLLINDSVYNNTSENAKQS